MNTPEMILFDYGRTLLYQPGFNTTNGNKAIYPYISENPRNISFEEYDKTITDLFAKIKAERGPALEIHEHNFLKMAWDYMGISMSVPLEEAEKIIMNGISKGGVMPHAGEMLDYLNAKGIRMGVISNICFSGNVLKDLFDRLLPGNRFEFVLVSSDYLFKKPDSLMFEVALQKAGLSADKVWYCGDSIEADMYGAKSVGMFPVLYEGTTPDHEDPFAGQNDGKEVDFEHLHIHDWRELIAVLEGMK
ncbi:MAG: HAD-IA family hydrolase [Lachnospiraceae bacterium]|nr:HAD-IA family hydrolase [Lachnospiraceae bacterium]